MNRRQNANEKKDVEKENEDLRGEIKMLRAGMTGMMEMMRQMQSQLGSVSGQMLGSKERPWKTVFGDRYKAVIKTLNKYIPFDAISTIQYSNGTQIPYVTGFYVYSAMNAIFGPDAWSYTVSTIRSGQGLYSATVTISIAGVIRSNGSASKQTKGVAPEQLAIKSAITNAFKRAAANFGNVLGLCLYDKAYINEFIKEKKNKRIPLNEKKVIEELYELSHPDGEIDTKPTLREESMKQHVEGKEEGSITDLKEPEAATEEITKIAQKIPVAQVEDKTEYVEFVPSKGVITRNAPEHETDVRKRSLPVHDKEPVTKSVINQSSSKSDDLDPDLLSVLNELGY